MISSSESSGLPLLSLDLEMSAHRHWGQSRLRDIMLAERQLLFAVLAFEYEMLNLVQLQIACRTWADDKSKLLAELLVEWGWLTKKDSEQVDGAVHRPPRQASQERERRFGRGHGA